MAASGRKDRSESGQEGLPETHWPSNYKMGDTGSGRLPEARAGCREVIGVVSQNVIQASGVFLQPCGVGALQLLQGDATMERCGPDV